MFLKMLEGDVMPSLKTLEDESIDAIITSPPYWGLRDYGIEGQLGLEPTLTEYLQHMLEITGELQRVLKKTGVMWWDHGDCYGGSGQGAQTGYGDYKRQRVVRTMEKAVTLNMTPKCLALQNWRLIMKMIDEQGWILRNTVIWHKPNHMPSSVKDRLSNAYEPVFMLTKNKKYYFDLDAIRKPHKPQSIERAKWAIPGGVNGEHGRVHPSGKNPADVWEISQEERLQKHLNPSILTGGDGRTRAGLDAKLQEEKNHPLGKNPSDLWRIPTQPMPEAHFAVYPEKLIEPMIKASCPKKICTTCGHIRERITKGTSQEAFNIRVRDVKENRLKHQDRQATKEETLNYQEGETHIGEGIKTVGWSSCGCKQPEYTAGTVLDPFIGSGTTMVVARNQGVNCIGIDIKKEYLDIAKKRVLWGSSISDIEFIYETISENE